MREHEIVDEWHRWCIRMRPGKDGSAFFHYLESKKPELLDFQYTGDKWRAIQALLNRHRRITPAGE